jgi:hypothetical protein
MVRDPIVEEVRAIREALAKEHGFNVKAIVWSLQIEEERNAPRLVSLQPRRLPKKQRQSKAG